MVGYFYNLFRNRSGGVPDNRNHSQTETRRIRQPYGVQTRRRTA
jgi:hypothetical protein